MHLRIEDNNTRVCRDIYATMIPGTGFISLEKCFPNRESNYFRLISRNRIPIFFRVTLVYEGKFDIIERIEILLLLNRINF